MPDQRRGRTVQPVPAAYQDSAILLQESQQIPQIQSLLQSLELLELERQNSSTPPLAAQILWKLDIVSSPVSFGLNVGHHIANSLGKGTRDIASLQMEIDGRPVTLIDTPGFDDTNLSDGEVLKIIAEWLGIMYENRVLLTGVILLQPVDGNRAYGSEAKRTQLFRQICGKDTYENVVIATTMWSKLRNRSEGVDRVRQREESGDFWANLVNNGEGKSAKLVEYHDNVDSAHNIIRMVMENTKKPLKLQVELHESQGRLIDTTAGQQVDAELGATTAKKIKELHACEMRQFKEQYKEDIEKLKAEIQRLQVQKMMIQQEKVRGFLFFPSKCPTEFGR